VNPFFICLRPEFQRKESKASLSRSKTAMHPSLAFRRQGEDIVSQLSSMTTTQEHPPCNQKIEMSSPSCQLAVDEADIAMLRILSRVDRVVCGTEFDHGLMDALPAYSKRLNPFAEPLPPYEQCQLPAQGFPAISRSSINPIDPPPNYIILWRETVGCDCECSSIDPRWTSALPVMAVNYRPDEIGAAEQGMRLPKKMLRSFCLRFKKTRIGTSFAFTR
jgi:hypothetical protein